MQGIVDDNKGKIMSIGELEKGLTLLSIELIEGESYASKSFTW